MKKLRVGRKYYIVLPDRAQAVIVEVDDGDGWYTVRNLPDDYGPFAMNLNLAEQVRELDDKWDGDEFADWPEG